MKAMISSNSVSTSSLIALCCPDVFWVFSFSVVRLIMPIAVRSIVFIGLLLLLHAVFEVGSNGIAWILSLIVALLPGFFNTAWVVTSGVVCIVVGVL